MIGELSSGSATVPTFGKEPRMSAAFDMLAVARDLEQAGMDRAQAAAVAGAIRTGQGELATRGDEGPRGRARNRMMAAPHTALWMKAAGIVVAIIALTSVPWAWRRLWPHHDRAKPGNFIACPRAGACRYRLLRQFVPDHHR